MNTLSKVLAVFCLLLSAVVWAKWESVRPSMLSEGQSPTALATSADGKTVYFFNGFLYKSTDGGETWVALK
jgi:photosystem II stability/assembly factor-like uncharacterized protein